MPMAWIQRLGLLKGCALGTADRRPGTSRQACIMRSVLVSTLVLVLAATAALGAAALRLAVVGDQGLDGPRE